MTTSLRVIFDIPYLSKEFTIKNVSVVPAHGEYFFAEWTDFISDPEILQVIKNYEKSEIFVAYFLNKRYWKNHVEVSITLVSENSFNRSKDKW